MHLSACDILFNALATNDEVERIIFCSGKVMKGQSESSCPQKQRLNDASVCVRVSVSVSMCATEREDRKGQRLVMCDTSVLV